MIDEIIQNADNLQKRFTVLLDSADRHLADFAGKFPRLKGLREERRKLQIEAGTLRGDVAGKVDVFLRPGEYIDVGKDLPEVPVMPGKFRRQIIHFAASSFPPRKGRCTLP